MAGQDVDRQTGLLHPSLLNSVNTVSNSKAFSSPLKQDSTPFQGVTANTQYAWQYRRMLYCDAIL